MEIKKSKNTDGTEIEIIITDNAIDKGFKIGKPTDLEMVISTENKDIFQADVFLKSGWTIDELKEIITLTMLKCDSKVISVKATIQGIISAN